MADLVYGRVPHPPFRDRPITKPENWGQNDLGQRTVKGVSWHRMLGHLNGTYQHFTNPATKALTDYGVGVLAQDGAALDGVIDRYNDPLGRQSGWASGTFSAAAYGDGLAFVNKYGINAINRDRASIEISGLTYDVELSEKSRQAIAALTAYWADQYEIPWDVFPISPKDGFSFICWHNEFGPDNGTKKCPGKVVMDETPALIERTRAILKEYQVVEEPKFTKPLPLPFKLGIDLGWGYKLNGCPVNLFVTEVEALKGVVPRAWASSKAPKSGETIPVKTKFSVYGDCITGDGKQWFFLEDGSRIEARYVFPRIKFSKR